MRWNTFIFKSHVLELVSSWVSSFSILGLRFLLMYLIIIRGGDVDDSRSLQLLIRLFLGSGVVTCGEERGPLENREENNKFRWWPRWRTSQGGGGGEEEDEERSDFLMNFEFEFDVLLRILLCPQLSSGAGKGKELETGNRRDWWFLR